MDLYLWTAYTVNYCFLNSYYRISRDPYRPTGMRSWLPELTVNHKIPSMDLFKKNNQLDKFTTQYAVHNNTLKRHSGY